MNGDEQADHRIQHVLSRFAGFSNASAPAHHSAASPKSKAAKRAASDRVTARQSSILNLRRFAGLYFGASIRPQNAGSIEGKARAGKTSIRNLPDVAVRDASGSSVAPSFARNGQIGASLQNMPFRDWLDGCTPPPIQLTTDAANRSTGRDPDALGTIVG